MTRPTPSSDVVQLQEALQRLTALYEAECDPETLRRPDWLTAALDATDAKPLDEHKWLDPECGINGCQSLVWKSRYEAAVNGRMEFRQAYRELRAATDAKPVVPAEPVAGWQPIETAPKDMTEVNCGGVCVMYTREELISVCEAATVPVSEWRNRDTSSAQRQMGEAWVLLKAGAEISFSDDPATDNRTIWVRLRFPGFAHFDCDGSEETALFYLPTPESLANANGQDWY